MASEEDASDEEDIYNYYECDTEDNGTDVDRKEDDPEYFEFELLTVEDVERLLNELVEALCQTINVSYIDN